MRNEKMKWMIVAIVLVPTLCMAAPTVGDLSRIQGETMIIKAKASREAAQADLDARLRAKGGYGASDDRDVPVVKAVYGGGRERVATFLYSNGTTMEGSVGDTINGGYKVVKIAVDKVELSKDKKVIQVGFSATPTVSSPTKQMETNPPGFNGLPGAIR